MTQFHDWEWFTGEVPTGRVQVWPDGRTKHQAENLSVQPARDYRWGEYIIAFRRVKEPVRGEVVLIGLPSISWCFNTCGDGSDTHQLTLPTDDGALICGEYVGPGGAVVKVDRLATEDDGA